MGELLSGGVDPLQLAPEFRTLEAALFDGNLKQASALLRKLGRSLHLIGRPA